MASIALTREIWISSACSLVVRSLPWCGASTARCFAEAVEARVFVHVAERVGLAAHFERQPGLRLLERRGLYAELWERQAADRHRSVRSAQANSCLPS